MLMSNLVDTVWKRNDSSKLKKKKIKPSSKIMFGTLHLLIMTDFIELKILLKELLTLYQKVNNK